MERNPIPNVQQWITCADIGASSVMHSLCSIVPLTIKIPPAYFEQYNT